MNKRSVTTIGLTLLIIIIIILAVINSSKRSDVNVVKIGVIAPLTGAASIYGNSMVDGIKLAEQDMHGTKKTYQVIVEDDGSNPGQSASAAQKLINSDKVQAILTMTSATGNAVKPIATANKIPHICVCTDTTVANTEYNFTDLVSNESEARLWLSEAAKHKVHTVAIIAQNHPGFLPLIAALNKYSSEYGITIVHQEKWDSNSSDFKTLIAKSKATNPDIYWIGGFPPGADIIGQEMYDEGIRNISSSVSFDTAADPKLYEGLWYEDTGITSISFRDRFEKQFPGIRFNVRSAPFGYDMYNMVVKGSESGGDLNENLSSLTTFNGISGTTTLAAGTRNFYATPMLWIMKDGKPEPLSD